MQFRFLFTKPKQPPEKICAGCGYNLRSNESGSCPECGIPVSATPKKRRFLRAFLALLFLLFLYPAIYFTFSTRNYLWGGGVCISYPGSVRFYAITSKFSSSLGQSDKMLEEVEQENGTSHSYDDSLLIIHSGAWHNIWRIFYPAERLELLIRGIPPIPITYYNPTPVSPTPTTTTPASATSTPTHTVPFSYMSYEDWFVRSGKLYRLSQANYAARDNSNKLINQNDVYLFEWSLSEPWTKLPRPASSVRLIETNTRVAWNKHWIIDPDHWLTWDEHTHDVTLLTCLPGKPRTTATLKNIPPVRCNLYSPISVSRSGEFFAGETKSGLTIFRSDTLQPVRQIPDSPATKRFFEARPNELSNDNSPCKLMDDGTTLVRTLNTYFKGGPPGGIVVFNTETNDVRDYVINLGQRVDVYHVAIINSKLTLYLIYVDNTTWKHCLYTPDDQKTFELHPNYMQVESVAMNWDPDSNLFVALSGYPDSSPPLPPDGEIFIEYLTPARQATSILRYVDSANFPNP